MITPPITSTGDFQTSPVNVASTNAFVEIFRIRVDGAGQFVQTSSNTIIPITVINTGNAPLTNFKIARCIPASGSPKAYPLSIGSPVDIKTDFSSAFVPDLYVPYASVGLNTLAAGASGALHVNPRGGGEIVGFAMSSGTTVVTTGDVPKQ